MVNGILAGRTANEINIMGVVKKFILETVAENSYLFRIEDINEKFWIKTHDDKYRFLVENFNTNRNVKPSFQCTVAYFPKSVNSVGTHSAVIPVEGVNETLSRWVSTVKSYEAAIAEFLDPFYHQKRQELEKEFDLNVNEEDKSKHLSIEKQKTLLEFIEGVEQEITESEPESDQKTEFLSYSNSFKSIIPFISVAGAKKMLITLLVKAQKFGIRTFSDVKIAAYV